MTKGTQQAIEWSALYSRRPLMALSKRGLKHSFLYARVERYAGNAAGESQNSCHATEPRMQQVLNIGRGLFSCL